ncbi:MAG: hypothetical protein PHQ89_03245 [Bacilli bacterium]|nr:hypothetical protein [Bacilli bacterium]
MKSNISKKRLFIIFVIVTLVLVAVVLFIIFKNQNITDVTPPVIVFSVDGSESSVESITTTVTVTDTGSGVNKDTLKYVWTTTPEQPPITSFTTTFTSNSKISSPVGANGAYYLFVYAKDKDNNTAIVSSEVFNLKSDKVAKFNYLISYKDKLKIINFLEDNLTFSLSNYNNVLDINPNTISHYKYTPDNLKDLTTEQVDYLKDNYPDYSESNTYLPASVVKESFLAVTGVEMQTLAPFVNNQGTNCMIYIDKYDAYVHSGGHGWLGSSVDSYGIYDESSFWVLNFDEIEKLNDNKYKIKVYNYIIKNPLDDPFVNEIGTEDYIQQRLKLFFIDELTADEINLKKVTSNYNEIILKIIDDKMYFVSNIEK